MGGGGWRLAAAQRCQRLSRLFVRRSESNRERVHATQSTIITVCARSGHRRPAQYVRLLMFELSVCDVSGKRPGFAAGGTARLTEVNVKV